MNKTKVKRISRIALDVLLYVFLAVCLFSVLITIFSDKSGDGAATIFGRQMRIVTSDSMEKCEQTDVSKWDVKSIPLRSMVFIQVVPESAEEADAFYASLCEGDVLTFRYAYATQVTITHRITNIREKDTGGYIIELAGDNKNADSEQLYQTIDTSQADSPNYVIGKVTGQARLLGFVLSLLKSPVGIICVIIVPCFIIILLEVIKILGIVNGDKKKKAAALTAEKDSEIEALRRRLAQLEAKAPTTDSDTHPTDTDE